VNYRIEGFARKACKFSVKLQVDSADFSGSELAAMDLAWDCVIDASHGHNDFFHNPKTFMGRAWSLVQAKDGEPIAWSDIVSAYDAVMGSDHRNILKLVSA
jgi:hypothetical protein